MKYRGLELKLRKLIEKRQREGWLIFPTLSVIESAGTCCLLGAVIAGDEFPDVCFYRAAASRRLKIEYGVLSDIEMGFMGWDALDVGSEDLRAIGARIRRDYCETTDEVVS